MLLLLGVEMWKLKKFVIPKIKYNWEDLAYSLSFTISEVEMCQKESSSLEERCKNILNTWLGTNHGPRPKTYQTLLKYIKKVDELRSASEVIERELIEGRYT